MTWITLGDINPGCSLSLARRILATQPGCRGVFDKDFTKFVAGSGSEILGRPHVGLGKSFDVK